MEKSLHEQILELLDEILQSATELDAALDDALANCKPPAA